MVGEHHGHEQHVRFHGVPPDLAYREYRVYAARVRKVIRDELHIPVLTLQPFLGVGHAEEDYRRLHGELGLAPLPIPPDTSAYLRDPVQVAEEVEQFSAEIENRDSEP